MGYGVPIGAFLATEDCMALARGDHGSTFAGNALTTAAACAGIQYLIDHTIPAQVKRIEPYLLTHVQALRGQGACIAAVRVRGLLAAMEFDSDIAGEHHGAPGTVGGCPQPLPLSITRALRSATPLTDKQMRRKGFHNSKTENFS